MWRQLKQKTIRKHLLLVVEKNVICLSRIGVFMIFCHFHYTFLKSVCDFKVVHLVSAVVFCMIVLICLMYVMIFLFR
jgi:hypothetical protein